MTEDTLKKANELQHLIFNSKGYCEQMQDITIDNIVVSDLHFGRTNLLTDIICLLSHEEKAVCIGHLEAVLEIIKKGFSKAHLKYQAEFDAL